jgi:hypothetical protein
VSRLTSVTIKSFSSLNLFGKFLEEEVLGKFLEEITIFSFWLGFEKGLRVTASLTDLKCWEVSLRLDEDLLVLSTNRDW